MHSPILSEASWAYNPLQVDAYLLHLASISPRCTVTVAEDIYSHFGDLLLAQGQPLTLDLAQRMQQSLLRTPIEDSIELSSQLDEKKLCDDLIAVMKQDDIFFALNERVDFTALIATLCPLVIQAPLLRQKLSVMSFAMPDLYQRSLYCTWLSLCIAKEMRLSQVDTVVVFVAALGHDIGMLHIDLSVVHKTTAISAEDWLCIQRHVVIGQGLLKRAKMIPSAVAQAIYEHHEQSDGTGYPGNKLENELGLFGQIVNVADAIVAIYCNYDKSRRHSWRDVIPLIHMNAQAYFTRANEILLAIVRRADLPKKNVVEGDVTPEFIAELLAKNAQLKVWFDSMHDSLLSLGFRHGDKRLHALQNVMLHLTRSAEGSGIFNANKTALLTAPEAGTDHSSALSIELLNQEQINIETLDVGQHCEKIHLMQQEIIFHLQRLSRMTYLYIESGECKDKDIQTALTRSLQMAKKCLLSCE